MKYIIDEEELIELKSQTIWFYDDKGEKEKEIRNCVDNFLKSKQPVELIASGRLDENGLKIIQSKFKSEYKNKEIEIYVGEK